ncbi:KinB-signaling pathway activation protein [Paenibacillus sp. J31TS4]|uniref:KinB-signaling pathway activation protein n=1 Tax=Paenibacillus sp. J31TS4 TaxID=2807195 RepID=UPI001B060AAA|nr:KinB-signaling pathway activation protein [Paenibacillus sp. J31TS4]GIP41460.1 KinB-signaling pathway activation protein [Paenibacillus sp. J31TS4]
MTLKKLLHWIWTTLAIGTLASLVLGIFLIAYSEEFSFLEVSAAGFNVETIIFVILGGATISVLSQMGFFSYLVLRYIAIGIFKSRLLWDILQVMLILITFFDFIYLRYTNFKVEGQNVIDFSLVPVVLLFLSLAVTYWKVKETNKSAFISTLFFLFVATTIEAVPALKLNSISSDLFMLTPLFVCNAWQIMLLHRIVGNKKEPTAG